MTPIQPSTDLNQQQLNLETEMTTMGLERFHAKVNSAVSLGMEDKTTYGNSLVDKLLDKVSDALGSLFVEREAGRAGRKGVATVHLAPFRDDLRVPAFIALRMIISTLSSPSVNQSSMAARIGRMVEDEVSYQALLIEDKKLWKRTADMVKKRSAVHVKRKVANIMLARSGVDVSGEWATRTRLIVGMTLIEAIINSTGLIERYTTSPKAKETHIYLRMTPEARKFVADRKAATELLRPIYEPMIVPPQDWTTPLDGGYLSDRVQPVRLVKTRLKGYLSSLASVDMPEVYGAVNAAQRTAWSINPFILTMLEMSWELSHPLGGVPSREALETPPKPHDIADNDDARKAWRQSAHRVFMANRELEGKRISFVTALNTATRYSLFPAIYMPHHMDFRGRIYAVPQLNPQGPDYMKALLMFAEGKPLDDDSAPFLAIHLANCGDFDKISKAPLEDRVAWVYANQEAIVACADSPFDNRWWTEADSPYCFLAACREWAGWLREGIGFVSHIPIALDGSCSGLQHFSMALADEVGGAAVNLIPSDTPSDIYTLVLDKVKAQVCLDASTCGEFSEVAGMWLRSGLLERNCVKRPTMTFGYGSSQFGFRDQIETDTLRPAFKAYQAGEGPWHFGEQMFGASLYLARVTQHAVEATVVKAAEAMTWLKAVSKVITAEGLPVRWTTPDGLPVVQHYREMKTGRVDTMIFGSRTTLQFHDATPKVCKRSQAAGLSPNFVHSLDAAHLRSVVNAAAAEGIHSFALVHDSFGTHAADTGRFFVILRETMVALYSDTDVVNTFQEEIMGQLADKNITKLPEPPARGTLDIQAVLESDYAFA